MKILIYFGDNDFACMYEMFGMAFIQRRWDEGTLTKATVVRWWNRIAPTLYEMTAGGGVAGKDKSRDSVASKSMGGEYLHIKADRVFFNAEVDEVLKTHAYGGRSMNGEALLIELDFEARPLIMLGGELRQPRGMKGRPVQKNHSTFKVI